MNKFKLTLLLESRESLLYRKNFKKIYFNKY